MAGNNLKIWASFAFRRTRGEPLVMRTCMLLRTAAAEGPRWLSDVVGVSDNIKSQSEGKCRYQHTRRDHNFDCARAT